LIFAYLGLRLERLAHGAEDVDLAGGEAGGVGCFAGHGRFLGGVVLLKSGVVGCEWECGVWLVGSCEYLGWEVVRCVIEKSRSKKSEKRRKRQALRDGSISRRPPHM
jgi:hypothetical protein